MKPKLIGTIFATEADMRRDDAFFTRHRAAQLTLARAALKGTSERYEQGETRFWQNDTQYATVNNAGRILWFEIRPDGFTYSLRTKHTPAA